MARNPVLLAAIGEVDAREEGLASGIVGASFMTCAGLGLAVLASVGGSRTDALIAAGEPHESALVAKGMVPLGARLSRLRP